MGKTKAVSSVKAIEAAPMFVSTPVVTEDNNEKSQVSWVVVRDGFRVSDREYLDQSDPVAIAEKAFWTKVAKNHSYNEPVKIVQYESKKHRIW